MFSVVIAGKPFVHLSGIKLKIQRRFFMLLNFAIFTQLIILKINYVPGYGTNSFLY